MGFAVAQSPSADSDPFTGRFRGDGASLEMTASGGVYSGTVSIRGGHFLATMKVSGTVGSGTYDANGIAQPFTLTQERDGLVLASGGAAYRLTRVGATLPPADAAQNDGELVGSWRNATSTAQFNADGTGVINGAPGRYEIRGNRLTMTGEQSQNTLRFEVHGDVLVLTVNGKPVTLNRVKDEVGEGSVRAELVGRWCLISLTAEQSPRKFSRCLTLNGGGTYALADAADSKNTAAGKTSPAGESGTWTATETSLSTHSLSGKNTTYHLQKRNHPGKVHDPMLVLDGQAYVSFFSKTPW